MRGASWRVLGRRLGDPGRACDERSGESHGRFREPVGGGFLWGSWVGKRDSFFFSNVSSKNQKSAHLPYQFRPQNESNFWGGVWGFEGHRKALIQPAPSTPVDTPGSSPRKHAQAAWRGAKSRHCVDTECAFHSKACILWTQNAWRVQGRPQASSGTV